LLGSAFTTCTENLKELIETGAVAPKPSKKWSTDWRTVVLTFNTAYFLRIK
jgi:hypothetical protein